MEYDPLVAEKLKKNKCVNSFARHQMEQMVGEKIWVRKLLEEKIQSQKFWVRKILVQQSFLPWPVLTRPVLTQPVLTGPVLTQPRSANKGLDITGCPKNIPESLPKISNSAVQTVVPILVSWVSQMYQPVLVFQWYLDTDTLLKIHNDTDTLNSYWYRYQIQIP